MSNKLKCAEEFICLKKNLIVATIIFLISFYICIFTNINIDIQNGVSLKFKDIRWIYIFIAIQFIDYYVIISRKWKKIDIRKWARDFRIVIHNNKNNLLVSVLTAIVLLLLTGLLENFVLSGDSYINPYRWFALWCITFIVSIAIIYRGHIWKNAHIYFFVISMLSGSVAIVSFAPAYISWDEAIHYTRTSYMSLGAKGYILEVDPLVETMSPIQYDVNGFQKEQRVSFEEYLNTYDSARVVPYDVILNFSAIAYIPASIALFVGRQFGLSFVANYMLGKLTNLFLYSLFFAMSIKLLKERGKIIAAVVGLIPTSMFIAVCYSYDWWINALIVLGFSLFISEIQSKGYITNSRLIKSIAVLVAGLLPKPVYFPLLFPLMILKKEKYEDSKKARWIVVLGMLVLLASFMLPILIGGGGEGDVRGGADVNSAEQIKYILGNLLDYAKMMLTFLWGYLSPDRAAHYLNSFAYVGIINYTTISLLMLCIATIVDNSDKLVFRKNTPWLRGGNVLGIIGSVVLVATSMYVSFTPVALPTINGCQPRYLIPVLFVFLFFSGENRIKISKELKEKAFVFVNISMALVFLNGWYELIISKY